MASLGYNVALHRTLAFGIGALIAGVGGVLYAWWFGQLSPTIMGLDATIQLLVIAVIGGLRRIEGAWLGAVAFLLINNEVTNRIPASGLPVIGGTFNTVIGFIFLAIVIVSPDGLDGALGPALERRRPKSSASRFGGRASPQPRQVARREVRYRRSTLVRLFRGDSRQVDSAGTRGGTMKLGRWKLLLPLAVLVVGSTIATSGALATTAQSGEVRFAIMTDCKGAFAFGYEVDSARHDRGSVPVRGREAEEQEEAFGGNDRRDGWRQAAEPRRHRLRRRDSCACAEGDAPAHEPAQG